VDSQRKEINCGTSIGYKSLDGLVLIQVRVSKVTYSGVESRLRKMLPLHRHLLLHHGCDLQLIRIPAGCAACLEAYLLQALIWQPGMVGQGY
jgi:hypothetical protein